MPSDPRSGWSTMDEDLHLTLLASTVALEIGEYCHLTILSLVVSSVPLSQVSHVPLLDWSTMDEKVPLDIARLDSCPCHWRVLSFDDPLPDSVLCPLISGIPCPLIFSVLICIYPSDSMVILQMSSVPLSQISSEPLSQVSFDPLCQISSDSFSQVSSDPLSQVFYKLCLSFIHRTWRFKVALGSPCPIYSFMHRLSLYLKYLLRSFVSSIS